MRLTQTAIAYPSLFLVTMYLGLKATMSMISSGVCSFKSECIILSLLQHKMSLVVLLRLPLGAFFIHEYKALGEEGIYTFI